MSKFLVFILGLPLGLAILIYRKNIVDFTGKFDWIEETFGMGSTYTALIFIGLLVWIFTMMYALGTLDSIFGFLGKYFNG